MEWFNNLMDKAFGWIGDFIKNSSWTDFSLVIAAVIIILLVIGIITFWWLLLHKFMNHGGDH